MKKFYLVSGIVVALLMSGCGNNNEIIYLPANTPVEDNTTEDNTTQEITKAFFGDKEQNRVVVVNVEEMKLAEPTHEVFTGHEITYTADNVFMHPKAYVVNRGSNAIDVIDTNTIEITKTIPLEHFPRSSEQMNKTLRLNETSGMDKAMASIIDVDTDEVVVAVGTNVKVDTITSKKILMTSGSPQNSVRFLQQLLSIRLFRAKEIIRENQVSFMEQQKAHLIFILLL